LTGFCEVAVTATVRLLHRIAEAAQSIVYDEGATRTGAILDLIGSQKTG